jgi:hypothetical protein
MIMKAPEMSLLKTTVKNGKISPKQADWSGAQDGLSHRLNTPKSLPR